MTKKDRQLVFDKYGGRCAYCGCELVKGWHVDEIEPVRRNYKYVHGHWKVPDGIDAKYIGPKTVPNGCLHPERFHIDNQNPACASCNINKHSMDLEEFRKMVAGFVNSLNQYSTQYKIAKRYGLIHETGIDIKFYFETINQ